MRLSVELRHVFTFEGMENMKILILTNQKPIFGMTWIFPKFFYLIIKSTTKLCTKNLKKSFSLSINQMTCKAPPTISYE